MDILTAPILIPLLAIVIGLIVVACMIADACGDIDDVLDSIDDIKKSRDYELSRNRGRR